MTHSPLQQAYEKLQVATAAAEQARAQGVANGDPQKLILAAASITRAREEFETLANTEVSLEDGRKLIAIEYEALSQLARLNGCELERVLEGATIQDGRVVALDFVDLGLTDISPLSAFTALTELWLNDNQISDLAPLSGLTALTELWLNDNQISDLTPLSGLTALTDLWLSGNQISDLNPLSGLTALTYLDLKENQISDLTPLSGLSALTRLWLEGNPIPSKTVPTIAVLKSRGVEVNL